MPETLADPLARASDPATSFQAADSMKDVAGYQARAVMRALRHAWPEPLAAEQIAETIPDMEHVAVNRRLSDLERLCHIEKTNQFHINYSGRRAHKFALVPSQGEMTL